MYSTLKAKWSPGSHPPYNRGHCVVLSDDEEMWDIDCDRNHGAYPFVCQRRLKPPPTSMY